jgi:CubicO group peptidase (beta-lactamase class C family)
VQRRAFLRLAGVTGLAAVSPVRRALAQPADPLDRLTVLIEERLARYGVPGVAFGVLTGGRVTTRHFGVTNIDNPQPITTDTVFPIASISKTVAATAAMRLVEDGRLALDASVREYLPDFRVQDERASRELRVWHLLTHTPGFEGQLPPVNRGAETLARFVVQLRDVPQFAPPGEMWSYNNAGFSVLGRLLEVVADATIHDAFRELVFAPLGLTHAFTETGTAMSHRFAAGHRQDASERTAVVRPFELPAGVAAGGAAMSIASLLAYAAFHLGDGTSSAGQRVLSRASLAQMQAPRLPKRGTGDEIGLGWHLRTLNGVRTCVHGGTLGGHCLHVQLVPERQLAFAILTNHANGWRLIQDVERAALQAYAGLSLAPNQATGGNRGVNEDMTAHAVPLAEGPDLSDYDGQYIRAPLGTIEVRAADAALVLTGAGMPPAGTSLAFYRTDLAYATAGSYTGMPVEFIRDEAGAVRWMRVNGRVARKV